MDEAGEEVEQAWAGHRRRVLDVGYRMLGSVADAEEVTQEAFLRLARADRTDIEDVRGWLVTVVGRLCLDRLRADARRAAYIGPWLPEPVVDPGPGIEDRVTLDDSVRMALLVVLSSCHRRSGPRSCSTTCSRCPSTTSPTRWAAPPPRAASSLLAPGVASPRAPPRHASRSHRRGAGAGRPVRRGLRARRPGRPGRGARSRGDRRVRLRWTGPRRPARGGERRRRRRDEPRDAFDGSGASLEVADINTEPGVLVPSVATSPRRSPSPSPTAGSPPCTRSATPTSSGASSHRSDLATSPGVSGLR